jgi:hypothetical protein
MFCDQLCLKVTFNVLVHAVTILRHVLVREINGSNWHRQVKMLCLKPINGPYTLVARLPNLQYMYTNLN